jgi:hypothetical protein
VVLRGVEGAEDAGERLRIDAGAVVAHACTKEQGAFAPAKVRSRRSRS